MTYTTPKVHEALSAILESLSVEKGGQLPANMGGKPYITATDLNLEAKRKFVEHGLVLLPSEKIVRYEPINGTRLSVLIAIEGTYTLIAKEDGSTVSFGGVGDGLANGSAVASNIASTNALKNALLRLFLVTEQSVEDAAKNGTDDAKTNPAESKIAKASGGPAKPATAVKGNGAAELRNQIITKAKSVAESTGIAETYYRNIGDRLTGTTNAADRKWINDTAVLTQVLAAIDAGETE